MGKKSEVDNKGQGGDEGMTIWEYFMHSVDTVGGKQTVQGLQSLLDDLGREGWDLVTIQSLDLVEGKMEWLVFKRPKQS